METHYQLLLKSGRFKSFARALLSEPTLQPIQEYVSYVRLLLLNEVSSMLLSVHVGVIIICNQPHKPNRAVITSYSYLHDQLKLHQFGHVIGVTSLGIHDGSYIRLKVGHTCWPTMWPSYGPHSCWRLLLKVMQNNMEKFWYVNMMIVCVFVNK